MREVKKRQFQFGKVAIEDIWLDPKSRDDMPAVLKGLQHLYKAHREELLSAVRRLVVRSGHAVARKKLGAPLRGRCDSFAVETDVHYPTDVNLLWDAMRRRWWRRRKPFTRTCACAASVAVFTARRTASGPSRDRNGRPCPATGNPGRSMPFAPMAPRANC